MFGTPSRQPSRTGASLASRPSTPATTIAGGLATSPAVDQALTAPVGVTPDGTPGAGVSECGPFGRQPAPADGAQPAFGRASRAAPFGLQAMVAPPSRRSAGAQVDPPAAPTAAAFGSAGVSVPVFGLPAMAPPLPTSLEASAKRGREDQSECAIQVPTETQVPNS